MTMKMRSSINLTILALKSSSPNTPSGVRNHAEWRLAGKCFAKTLSVSSWEICLLYSCNRRFVKNFATLQNKTSSMHTSCAILSNVLKHGTSIKKAF
jgi:hypothetical protein